MNKSKNLKKGVMLSNNDVEYIDSQIEKGEYINCSQFIREAVREKIKREK